MRRQATISTGVFQREIGQWIHAAAALGATVHVTDNGEPSVVLVSAAEHARLTRLAAMAERYGGWVPTLDRTEHDELYERARSAMAEVLRKESEAIIAKSVGLMRQSQALYEATDGHSSIREGFGGADHPSGIIGAHATEDTSGQGR